MCRRGLVGPRVVRLALGWGLAANELIWWVYRYSHEGVHRTNLPLQLCDVTVWLSVVACLTLRAWAVEFTYFAGIAGAGMALLTPDLWSPWPSYPAIYFFLTHGGMVVACVVLSFGRAAPPLRTAAPACAFAVLVAYALALGAFNAILGTNYMYLCAKPRSLSLLNWLGPWPVYLGGAAAIGVALFWLLWLPVRWANR